MPFLKVPTLYSKYTNININSILIDTTSLFQNFSFSLNGCCQTIIEQSKNREATAHTHTHTPEWLMGAQEVCGGGFKCQRWQRDKEVHHPDRLMEKNCFSVWSNSTGGCISAESNWNAMLYLTKKNENFAERWGGLPGTISFYTRTKQMKWWLLFLFGQDVDSSQKELLMLSGHRNRQSQEHICGVSQPSVSC